jgi:plastocyanin
MDRREFLAAAGTLGVGGLAGCTAMGSDTQGDISMRSVAYYPTRYETTVGSEVVWYNVSSAAHTVTAYEENVPAEADYFASGGYESEGAAREAWRADFGGAINSGETWSYTFEVPGTYQYFCVPHEQGGMIGTVVVTESGAGGGETGTDPASNG